MPCGECPISTADAPLAWLIVIMLFQWAAWLRPMIGRIPPG
jgi:hypothetical protein